MHGKIRFLCDLSHVELTVNNAKDVAQCQTENS